MVRLVVDPVRDLVPSPPSPYCFFSPLPSRSRISSYSGAIELAVCSLPFRLSSFLRARERYVHDSWKEVKEISFSSRKSVFSLPSPSPQRSPPPQPPQKTTKTTQKKKPFPKVEARLFLPSFQGTIQALFLGLKEQVFLLFRRERAIVISCGVCCTFFPPFFPFDVFLANVLIALKLEILLSQGGRDRYKTGSHKERTSYTPSPFLSLITAFSSRSDWTFCLFSPGNQEEEPSLSPGKQG